MQFLEEESSILYVSYKPVSKWTLWHLIDKYLP